MGFRGEAMASIAAVAQVELKTRRADEELGTELWIEGSEVKRQEPCQCNVGTSICLKNLFYNVPARRNFLKSNPVEMRHIIEEFQRIALAHPDVFFSLHHNDHELFHIKAGNLRQRIVSLLGNNYNEKLVPVEEQVDFMKIYGYIGKPDSAKRTRGEQYFFINNRYVRNPYLNHAVFTNYDELIQDGSFPLFVLFIDIDPARIDINVHPTKQEIKFDDEKTVYGFIRVSVRHALGKYSVTPTLDFQQEQALNFIQARGDDSQGSQGFITRSLGDFGSGNTSGHSITGSNGNANSSWHPSNMFAPTVDKQQHMEQSTRNNLKNWQQLYDISIDHDQKGYTIKSDFGKPEPVLDAHLPEKLERVPTQVHNRYILSSIKSGFILIDQQSAHERILYERFLRALNNKPQASQQLLFPQHISCSASDVEVLKEILPDINVLGFDIQEFGQNDFVIHGMPADIIAGNEQDIIDSLLENYKNNLSVLKLDRREGLARSMAQQASVKAGQVLQAREMENLIDELFACEQPYVAPNGRLTFSTFDLNELDKRFSPNRA
jgi:DNA mismatch repair protein MutL